MTERMRLVLLVLIMTGVSLIVGGIAVFVLYLAAIDQARSHLVEIAQSQARLIEAVARFDAANNRNYPEGSEAATLAQIIDAHNHYRGFGETGEFSMGRREGDNIVFLLSHRHSDLINPPSVPFNSNLAEPMRRALLGQSGTTIGLDYRGRVVLAAYEPVKPLNMGIAVKIDVWEVRAPFIQAAAAGLSVALCVVLAGALLFMGVTNPMIRRLQDLYRSGQQELAHRKQAEQALRQQRDFAESLVETAHSIILVLDTQARIDRFNPFMKELSGYELAEVRGKDWFETFVPKENRAAARSQFGHATDTFVTGGAIYPIVTKDGIEREIAWWAKTLKDVQGNVLGLLAIGHDVTDLREAQQRLLQAERLAAIGQMVAGLAHESRNALQRGYACLEMLRLEIDGQNEALDLTRRIQKALDDLHHLYEEVRNYAAPINLNRELCDLAHVWRATWAHLEPARNGRTIVLREDLGDVSLTCQVDSFALGQVFANVLDNAIDVCPDPGEIVIRSQETELAGQPAVQIGVRDNGPGIPHQDRPKVFEPFYTTKTKGTGLGMAIARRIVEAHGGQIAIGETSAKGAEFLITLPRGSS